MLWRRTPPRRCPCASFLKAKEKAQSTVISVACATGSTPSLATMSSRPPTTSPQGSTRWRKMRVHQRAQRDSELRLVFQARWRGSNGVLPRCHWQSCIETLAASVVNRYQWREYYRQRTPEQISLDLGALIAEERLVNV